ncbi:MAG TPA: hypothetical protein VE011_11495 [Candidatus Dormibacteraeota bacterium]|nr:hypothetical protein [Candidatus Dormibacteraeota bacterium]
MSKRHNNSRRRTYGRRQHELHERIDRRTERGRADRSGRSGNEIGLDPVSFADAPATEQHFGFGD